ncbi:MAG: CocE/NonD family hydrolase [Thermoanaerobaculia bacterium]|nr:CocE/NonD family hydrolase [Thermoanaerobaculia bacterium]
MTRTRILAALLTAALLACQGSVYPIAEELPRLEARHVEMRDGVRIAIDVWLPEGLRTGTRVPTLMRMTRYWRAQDIVGGDVEDDSNYTTAQRLGAAGYAYVIVDARGSGASFGTRPYELSADEIADYGEIAGWIADQPWSNGRVGSFGVSYDGTTAELLLASRPPAVKAVAPLFPDFQVFDQLLYPGGVFLEFFTDDWGASVWHMDTNDVCALQGVEGEACTSLRTRVSGVKPVDGDDGSLLAAAVAEHRDNAKVAEAARSVQFRDDPFGAGGPTNVVEISTPAGRREEIEATGAAIFTRVGWLDAGTVNGALSRFLTFSNPQQVVIGAWSHGGGADTDPFMPVDTPPEPSRERQMDVMLAFFDRYLKEGGEPLGESSITYFTMGSREWQRTTEWPPPGLESRELFLDAGGRLAATAPTATSGADSRPVDYTHTTGAMNRWHTNIGVPDVVYPDRRQQDEKILTWTGEPLAADTEITGHPLAVLWVASSHTDAAVHVYLEAVAPDGRVVYLTEGQLRALLRKTAEGAPLYHPFGPHRTFLRRDAEELQPGVPVELEIDLWATSVVVPAGYRLRLAIAGADAGNFARYPRDGGDATLTVERNATRPSRIVLPVRER